MKNLKKYSLIILLIVFNSCATVFGGHITEAQRTKPKPGEPSRQVRVVALIFDIITAPVICIPVDFIDGAIYKPVNK